MAKRGSDERWGLGSRGGQSLSALVYGWHEPDSSMRASCLAVEEAWCTSDERGVGTQEDREIILRSSEVEMFAYVSSSHITKSLNGE